MGDDSKIERTFQFEEALPSLPVPELDKTLPKYLESVKVFATDEEIENTKKLIDEFQNGVGKQLQEKLVEKAKSMKNWLEEWWEDIAYLRSREPMAVIGTMAGPSSINQNFWPLAEGTQIRRASENMFGFTKFFLMSRREEVPIMRDRSKNPFSMYQYRSLFSTSRVPGDPCDSLAKYFKTVSEGHCPSHIAVFCNGHIFKVEMLDKSGTQLGTYEIQRQLSYIKSQSKEKGQGIGVLSADDRTSWAKAYAHLVSLDAKNKENLEAIQSSIICVSLDAERPGDIGDSFRASMCGENPQDRWFDKSTTVIFFENGAVGYLADHCPYDGLVINLTESWVDDLIIKSKTDWLGSPNVQSDEFKPEELIFTVDATTEEAKLHAAETYKNLKKKIDACPSFFHTFGRNFAKEQSIHPDIFFQLAIQLTYYTKYGKPAPCYETATTRKYYHGRTETVRSTTTEAVKWCKAMNNPDVSAKDKINLLRAATGKQMMLGYDGLQAKGIDRHLLGLYLMSRDMGIDTPAIFSDPLFTKSGGNGNYVLSTSLTGYERGFGGVVPMRKDGYGIFYNLCKEEFYILVISYKDCEETNSLEFFQELCKSLIRMQEVILEAKK